MHPERSLLILAGAGSGKTRVITYRVAYLLEQGIAPSAILAVTFTNKAAREMTLRLRRLCRRKLPDLTICTFHAFGVRVLKEFGPVLGYRIPFSIYDEADRQSLIKEAARDLRLDLRQGDNGLNVTALASFFSRLKGQRAEWDETNEHLRPLFEEYQHRLKLFAAVDFDDLIGLPLQLWRQHPHTLSELQARYRYLMVDEFQDTSALQYELIRTLARESGNVCVVGDDDQSIYSWRGANYDNMLRFEQDFPDQLQIKLEQNYRSTRNILALANGLIEKNVLRKPKKLWSAMGEGDRIRLSFPGNENEEAEMIKDTIRSLALRDKLTYDRFGVLVRTNGLMRAIEEVFVKEGVPYKVSGGMSFFQRREVKDIIAYLRILANPDDDINLLRVINRPRRGIGKKTLEVTIETARSKSCSLYSALVALCHAGDAPLADSAKKALEDFQDLAESYHDRFFSRTGLAKSLKDLIEEIEYWGFLVQEYPTGSAARWKMGNVEGMVDSLAAYEDDPDNPDPSLFDYLNRIALISREDAKDDPDQHRVNLMTIHAAKGLEFDVVFVAGLEEGIMPHAMSLSENDQNVEEERRLLYVAITRARGKLFLSASQSRRRRGELIVSLPSPFLDELPQDLLEHQVDEKAVSESEARNIFAQIKNGVSEL